MSRFFSQTAAREPETTFDKAVDTVRHAAHISHEANLLKTVAADVVEDGVYAAKRALKKARRFSERAVDLRDEAAYRIKRQPFRFLGLALGVGIQVGLILAWAGARAARRRRDERAEW